MRAKKSEFVEWSWTLLDIESNQEPVRETINIRVRASSFWSGSSGSGVVDHVCQNNNIEYGELSYPLYSFSKRG